MKELLVLLFLAFNAWSDWKERKILLTSVGVMLVLRILFLWNDFRVVSGIAGSMGIPFFFLVISLLTKGALGMGDVWIILVLGMYLEVWKLLLVLMSGLFLAAMYSGWCLLLGKKKRKSEIPFVPFLLFGYAGGLWIW